MLNTELVIWLQYFANNSFTNLDFLKRFVLKWRFANAKQPSFVSDVSRPTVAQLFGQTSQD